MNHIVNYLKSHLSPARFKHTIGTVKVARQLAQRYNVPVLNAEQAALLHDSGKGFSTDAMIDYVRTHRIAIPLRDDIITHSPSLLHSYISAHIARTVFGIKDKDVLHAITAHTLGAPTMSTLAKIMYVADSTSPDRRYPACTSIRALANRDIDAAVVAVMANKFYYVIREKKWLHPHAAAAWNCLIGNK
jgi:nicotinate-nucleotide adenylyltransferase